MRRRCILGLLGSAAIWVFATGCTRPGQGAKAEAGYQNARPVIAALERYRQKHQEYPAALRDLAPGELPESAWKTSGGEPLDEFFRYEKSGASYRLQFSYSGPGMNRCVYTPESAQWDCAGAY